MAVESPALEQHEPAPVTAVAPRVDFGSPSVVGTFRETWRSRHLFWLFSVFAIKRMFILTVLGPAWILIQVAMDIAGKTFLFGSVLDVKTPGGVPYIIFLLVGMLGWTLFQQTLTFGTRSFQRYRKYAENLHFPLVIVPIAAGAQALLHLLVYFLVVVAGLGYYALRGQAYYETGLRLLLVPYGLALCLLFSWGLAFLLAPLNYRKRDVRFVLTYVLQFWMYVTPVVYPLQALDGAILWAAKLNPLAPMVEMIKFGMIGGGDVGTRFIAWATLCALVAFFSGLLVINHFGPRVFATELFNEEDEDDL